MAKTIVLDSTTKSISAFAASVSGAAIDYITTWADSTSSTFVEGESDGQLTNSTPVTIVAAPAASTRRVIKTINLYNAGAYSETVTLTLVNGANTRIIVKVSIAPGVTWTSDDLITYTTTVTATSLAYRNALINGDFQVSQRTPPLNFSSGIANQYGGTGDYTTFSTAYTHDRWMILHSNGSAVFTVSRRSDVPGTQMSSCAIVPASTSAGKFGLLQLVDANNTAPLRGNPATLSFWAKRDATTGTKITNVKAVILQWSGTADTMPRAVVNGSFWNGTGTPPSWAANVSQAATPTDIPVSDVWNRFTLTVPTIAGNNVAVFIWNDRIDNQTTDTLFLTDVQLERGLVATPFETLPLSTCLSRCYPYFYASWGGVVNGATSTSNTSFGSVSLQTNPSNSQEKVFRGSVVFPQQMRALPTGSSKGTASIPAFRIINSATNSLGAIDRPAILTTSRDRLEFIANSGINTTLTAALSTTATKIAVNSTAALPTFGSVRIGSEYITYTEVNTTSDAYTTTLASRSPGVAWQGTTGAMTISAITAGGSVTVASTAAFPASGSFIIDSEIFNYTSKDAGAFIGVTRAQEGTAAATHAVVNNGVKQAVFLTGCLRAQSGSTAAQAALGTTVLYRFNNLTAGTYEMQHNGSVPSFFHANAEL